MYTQEIAVLYASCVCMYAEKLSGILVNISQEHFMSGVFIPFANSAIVCYQLETRATSVSDSRWWQRCSHNILGPWLPTPRLCSRGPLSIIIWGQYQRDTGCGVVQAWQKVNTWLIDDWWLLMNSSTLWYGWYITGRSQMYTVSLSCVRLNNPGHEQSITQMA